MITNLPRLLLLLCLAAPENEKWNGTTFFNLPGCPWLDGEVDNLFDDLDLDRNPAFPIAGSYWGRNIYWLRVYGKDYYNLPASGDLYRLPSRQFCGESLKFRDGILEKIDEQIAVCCFWERTDIRSELYQLQGKIRASGRPMEWLHYAHGMAGEMASNKLTVRHTLGMLRDNIGYQAYYEGSIPPPVPLNLFLER